MSFSSQPLKKNLPDGDAAAEKNRKHHLSSPQQKKRTLSPHLGIYRWESTMLLSILHRLTGVFLWLVAVGVLLWASNVIFFGWFENILPMAFKTFLPFIWLPIVFSLACHGLNGIRHFFFDIGFGYHIKTARLTAWLVLGLSCLITLYVLLMLVR
ncbi:MAG: succinate dehydrogenase, cytochrome b556 subunit [Alphaproteobacteria bacterium]